MKDKRAIIADALLNIVEKAKHGAPRTRIGLMAFGSELGQAEVLRGAMEAQNLDPSVQVVAIGPKALGYEELEWIDTPDCEADVSAALDQALKDGTIAGAVAMHYPFPVGVTTIGRIKTPGRGRDMFIASCTGTSAPSRNEAMLRNALYGIAAAKASGLARPTVGLLNLDGANPVYRALSKLKDQGYDIHFGSSERRDGGSILRGNDVLCGAVDVLVCDTLTGNSLIKIFSAFSTGGQYESVGYGYGPSAGEGFDRIISIISRASGAPVIAAALALTAKQARNNLPALVAAELGKARKAGLNDIIEDLKPKAVAAEAAVCAPPTVPLDEQVSGIDVMDMENAVHEIWKAGIYAESAMGCTGPVIRIPSDAVDKVKSILKAAGYI